MYISKPYSNLNGEYPTVLDFEKIAKSVSENGKKNGITLFHAIQDDTELLACALFMK